MAEPATQAMTTLADENATDHAPLATVRFKAKMNYWSTLDPDDFVEYPPYEPLAHRAEMELIRKAQSGDTNARNIIWTQHTRLAYAAVNYFRIPEPLLADAIQTGIVGLNRAISKFDVDRDNAFSTYACHWVYQAMSRFLERQRHFVRVPSHLKSATYKFLRGNEHHFESPHQEQTVRKLARVLRPDRLSTIRPDNHPTDDLRHVDAEHDAKILTLELQRILRRRQCLIIKHRFGLERVRRRTLAAIAKKLGVSRERVRQLEKNALERLTSHLPPHFEAMIVERFDIDTPQKAPMRWLPLPRRAPRKAKLSLRKGRRKLLAFLHSYQVVAIVNFCEQVRNDTSFEHCRPAAEPPVAH